MVPLVKLGLYILDVHIVMARVGDYYSLSLSLCYLRLWGKVEYWKESLTMRLKTGG